MAHLAQREEEIVFASFANVSALFYDCYGWTLNQETGSIIRCIEEAISNAMKQIDIRKAK